MSIRFGIIGLGKMGKIRAQTILDHEDCELVAVSDVDPERSKDLVFEGSQFYEKWEDLVKSDLDAVFVCTYNQAAPEVSIEAIGNQKHVFCEKPAGRNLSDIQNIAEAIGGSSDLVLKFGFNHRWHYAISEAKSLIESNRFGKILWIRGTYGKCGSIDFESQWRNQKSVSGGGILLDQGIHMLDLFRYFMGDFKKIQSTVKTSGWDIPVEDNAFVILENDSNQVALLHSSATQWKHKFQMEIGLEDGYINVDGILSSTRSYGDEKISFAKKQLENQGHAFGKPREETIFFDRDDSWFLELNEFVEAILHKSDLVHGKVEDMLSVMKLVQDIYSQNASE